MVKFQDDFITDDQSDAIALASAFQSANVSPNFFRLDLLEEEEESVVMEQTADAMDGRTLDFPHMPLCCRCLFAYSFFWVFD